MTTIIHIDPEAPLHILDEHGWTQGSYDADAGVCLHGAIRLCQPIPGDAQIIEQVARRQGWGTDWNDDDDTTEQMVRDRLALGIDITDEDLADTFGPQWRAVIHIVRRAAVMTKDEAQRLSAAWSATESVAWSVARSAAWSVARSVARSVAWSVAWSVAGYSAGYSAGHSAGYVVTYDLATIDGPYTIAQRDLLLAPWIEVMGPIEGLIEPEGNA
jgi:plasmid maintenance system antidote protein VapI